MNKYISMKYVFMTITRSIMSQHCEIINSAKKLLLLAHWGTGVWYNNETIRRCR